jgi:hypothetical protein
MYESKMAAAHHQAVETVGVDVDVHAADIGGGDVAPPEPSAFDARLVDRYDISHCGIPLRDVECVTTKSYFTC